MHSVIGFVCRRVVAVAMVWMVVGTLSEIVAQPLRLGVKGSYLQVLNSSSMPVLMGSVDCGRFQDGVSSGVQGGITVDYPVFGPVLEVSSAVVYQQRPAQLVTRTTDDYTVLDPRTSSYVFLEREHVFTSDLGYIALELGLRSQPIPWLPVYLRASLDAGNPIVNATYQQTEEIVAPSGVLFPDGTQRREVGSGEFPGLGTSFGGYAGAGAVLDLTDRVQICPEVGFRQGLNSVTSRADWQQSWWSAGIQVRVRFDADSEADSETKSEEAAEPPPPPVITTLEPEPTAERLPPVRLAAVTGDPLRIQQTVVTQTFPLLPYVFFGEASSEIPARYRRTSPGEAFSESTIPKSTLPIYYSILDILGRRMAQDSSVRLTVIGSTDGRELPTASERMQLARDRAAAVVSYLGQRWNIAAERCEVVSRNRPRIESNTAYAEGVEENRRVELVTSDAEALGPVVHRRFLEYVPVQPRQDLAVFVDDSVDVQSWELLLHQPGGQAITRISGQGRPPQRIAIALDSAVTASLGPALQDLDSLAATLVLQLPEGRSTSWTANFPVVKTTSTFEVSRLSLIVFEYDDAAITGPNAVMMKNVISSAVAEGSRARIIGSTDRLGELDHNVELSEQRARSVEQLARQIAPQLVIDDVRGVGPGSLQYDNALPEGRFYCRTVSLTITTPLR